MTFDDFEARPGSAVSVLRTIVGVYLRDLGGSIRAADLVRLMEAAGVADSPARTAMSRVKNKGLLIADPHEEVPTYRLNPQALPTLARGDRRIFAYRQQGENDPWCLVSFSVPESHRAVRHQLRRRLAWLGAGIVADGLWIVPAHLTGEVEEAVTNLNLADAVTLFTAERPEALDRCASRWWDLTHLSVLHRKFLSHTRADAAVASTLHGADAFAHWVHAIDRWRELPYLDPGLPSSVLPADWPGHESVERFFMLADTLAPRARAFVDSVCVLDPPVPSPAAQSQHLSTQRLST